jgi:hypothetical protein
MLIQSPKDPSENKANKELNSAESGKVRHNPQPGRNQEEEEDYYGA